MPTICRLIRAPQDGTDAIGSDHAVLASLVKTATARGDVYRYWHAIEYLLAQHRPGSTAAKWLSLGNLISPASDEIPGARLLLPAVVRELDADLRDIQPEDLAPYYDAAALDAAQVYPATWQSWEETFDPLGQVLEHYSFLREFASKCASANAAMILLFESMDDGSV